MSSLLPDLTVPNLAGGLRDRVAAGFRRVVSGDPTGAPDWARALADGDDIGYFGPASAPWAVHGSLATIVGGVRALLMQAMHPGALAGVQQHSRYQQDGLGRLAGTARWLTVVTFGDTKAADRECARVRGMHRPVVGSYEVDGVPRGYSASDPDLLRWVHIAFTDSFLATHRVWGGPIPGGEDAYVREWARAGEMVGVTDAPRSVAELDAQLADYGPSLRGGPAVQETLGFIRNPPIPLAGRPAYAMLYAGAVSTMRPEHRELLELPTIPLSVTRPTVGALLGGLGAVLGPASPAMSAARERLDRVAATPGSRDLVSPGPSGDHVTDVAKEA